jgi:hypothetical protein
MTWQCETRCASASTRLATAALWSAAQNSSMSVASTTCAAKAILAALNDGEVLVTAVAMDEQAVNALPTAVFSNRRVEFERDADGAAHGDDRAVYCIAASDDERTRLIAELDELTSKCEKESKEY